ncbi:PREDICTED: organic solute transporter subunit beta isoform X2 [Calidris pugnax]|uniref:organic solute transporter subunit beta isoform X1 n=1 Tax=Calidris pugnax TaxID=198806 RepID=UPI00071CAA30|nr:PREDICTED: organic solute transporter subunit beta isoform X1 [Calidris pugnax]XP_014801583.1 PREDICTED: organic solute transporter subunit beta isoform X2 [Calidris pugnax]
MKFFWLIPFFLLQDAAAFLMKNAKFKLCLRASVVGESLLLEDCDPESVFQDWSWQGDSLLNRGTQSCLSLVGSNGVQMGLCDRTSYMSWDCSNSLLSPLGGSQSYLVANKKGVTLSNVRNLKAQWQDAADRSVCEVKAAEAEPDRYFTAALVSTHTYDPIAGNITLALGMDGAELEELLWFFRREDPSTWNYSVLALSFVAMILGLVLLALNIVRNRKRKIHAYGGAEQMVQQDELEAKQALMPVQEYSPAQLQKQEPVPQDHRSGDVMVQWKDGTVTSLYTARSEDAV